MRLDRTLSGSASAIKEPGFPLNRLHMSSIVSIEHRVRPRPVQESGWQSHARLWWRTAGRSLAPASRVKERSFTFFYPDECLVQVAKLLPYLAHSARKITD